MSRCSGTRKQWEGLEQASAFYRADESARHNEEVWRRAQRRQRGERFFTLDLGAWANDIAVVLGDRFGVTPAQASVPQLAEFLFELVPAEAPCTVILAPDLVGELKWFWRFLCRRWPSKRGRACLRLLQGQDTVARLTGEISRVALYSPRKRAALAFADDCPVCVPICARDSPPAVYFSMREPWAVEWIKAQIAEGARGKG